MDILLIAAIFLGGIAFTVGGLIILSSYAKKHMKQHTQTTIKTQDPIPNASVLDRLRQAAECVKEQGEIQAAHSMPNKNAVHSRYKNQLAARFKELEEKKHELLSSIVKDGFDPIVTGYNAETQQEETMPLSKFLGMRETPPEQEQETPPPENVAPESIKKVTKNGRTFFLIEGGKTTTQ